MSAPPSTDWNIIDRELAEILSQDNLNNRGDLQSEIETYFCQYYSDVKNKEFVEFVESEFFASGVDTLTPAICFRHWRDSLGAPLLKTCFLHVHYIKCCCRLQDIQNATNLLQVLSFLPDETIVQLSTSSLRRHYVRCANLFRNLQDWESCANYLYCSLGGSLSKRTPGERSSFFEYACMKGALDSNRILGFETLRQKRTPLQSNRPMPRSHDDPNAHDDDLNREFEDFTAENGRVFRLLGDREKRIALNQILEKYPRISPENVHRLIKRHFENQKQHQNPNQQIAGSAFFEAQIRIIKTSPPSEADIRRLWPQNPRTLPTEAEELIALTQNCRNAVKALAVNECDDGLSLTGATEDDSKSKRRLKKQLSSHDFEDEVFL